MSLDLSRLLISILIGLLGYFIAASIPATNKGQWPVVIGVLVAVLVYLGAFAVVP